MQSLSIVENSSGNPISASFIQWSKKFKGFVPRCAHAAVAVHNTIFSLGGINLNDHRAYSPDGPIQVFVLNIDDGDDEMKWRPLLFEDSEFNPNQRHSHSAVAYKEFVLIFGGRDTKKDTLSNSTYRLNTKTLMWDKPKVSGNIPVARSLHSCVVLENQLIVFGGENCYKKLTNDLHALDLDTFHWSIIQTQGIPPSLRYSHSATVYKDRFIFIFGGKDLETGRKCNDLLLCFNVITKEWTHPKIGKTTPERRWGHSTFVYNELVFVFGGQDYDYSLLRDLFCYNPENCEWTEVKTIGQPPLFRNNFGCVALDDRVFIFGGTDISTYLDDTCILEMQ